MDKRNMKFMKIACLLCDKSSCGYKVGCVAVKLGRVLAESFNETIRGEKYCQEGGVCVRKELGLSGGKDIDKVCTSHAEIGVIAYCAKNGIKLEGSDIYCTTFPCYICSKALVQAGIGRLYYMSDYATNDGKRFFDASDIPVSKIPENQVWA
jgi:dCMP deaminase